MSLNKGNTRSRVRFEIQSIAYVIGSYELICRCYGIKNIANGFAIIIEAKMAMKMKIEIKVNKNQEIY